MNLSYKQKIKPHTSSYPVVLIIPMMYEYIYEKLKNQLSVIMKTKKKVDIFLDH